MFCLIFISPCTELGALGSARLPLSHLPSRRGEASPKVPFWLFGHFVWALGRADGSRRCTPFMARSFHSLAAGVSVRSGFTLSSLSSCDLPRAHDEKLERPALRSRTVPWENGQRRVANFSWFRCSCSLECDVVTLILHSCVLHDLLFP